MTTETVDTNTAKILRGAVAGVLAGIVASFAMDRFQAAVSTLAPSDGDAEPATARAADRIKRVATGAPVPDDAQPLAGQIVHYAVGAGLGLAYGIAAEFRPVIAAGYGAPFGLGVAAVLDDAVVPATGLGTPPWEAPPTTHLYSAMSHLVFGTVAEFTRRQVRPTLLPAAS